MSAKHRTHRNDGGHRPAVAPSSHLAALRERRSFLKGEIDALLRLGMQKPDGAKHARGLNAAERQVVMDHQREISGIEATLRRFAA